jgi:hypothetical protein
MERQKPSLSSGRKHYSRVERCPRCGGNKHLGRCRELAMQTHYREMVELLPLKDAGIARIYRVSRQTVAEWRRTVEGTLSGK